MAQLDPLVSEVLRLHRSVTPDLPLETVRAISAQMARLLKGASPQQLEAYLNELDRGESDDN